MFDLNGDSSSIKFVLAVGISVFSFAYLPGAILGQETPAFPDAPYENLQILTGAPPDQLEQIMGAIALSLGVECEYCHVAGNWASDEREAKGTAREMMRMLADIDETYFGVLEAPSCWTCHRGSPRPETEPFPALPVGALNLPVGTGSALPFVDEDTSSGEVYVNIQNYTDLPARELRGVMETYNRDLGVGCDHCHVEGDWASDEVLMKRVARRMFEIQQGVGNEFLSEGALSCWTCHRGEALPQTNLPGRLLPQ